MLRRHLVSIMCKITDEYCEMCQMKVDCTIKTCSMTSNGWICVKPELGGAKSAKIVLDRNSNGDKCMYVGSIMNRYEVAMRCDGCEDSLKRKMSKRKTRSKPKKRSMFSSFFT
jgi:hypothetical protein